MEISEFAARVLHSPNLEQKLSPPGDNLTDSKPFCGEVAIKPGRPENLTISPHNQVRIPPLTGLRDPAQKARILHACVNHELQATELYAWAILAFGDAPQMFRKGLQAILLDEQRHTKMYIARMKTLGIALGDYPVTGYFWNKVETFTTPLGFVCAMALTFENANLDHTIDFAEAARQADDSKTAALVDVIHCDEIRHVHFGWKWLQYFKQPQETMWEAYCANVSWPLRPLLAKGKNFYREGREKAGLEPEFIRLLAQAGDD